MKSLITYAEWVDEGERTFIPSMEYQDFKLANDTLNLLLFEKTPWLTDNFIEYFEMKYKALSLSVVDEISLLMYEASITFSEEVAIYDIYDAARINLYGTHDNVYLLEKAIYYCHSYFYPLKIFFDIKKNARHFDDFRLLADVLKTMFDKFAIEISDALILDGVEELLSEAKKSAHTDNEKILLAFSYLQNGYIKDAEILMQSTIDTIFKSIKSNNTDYKTIHTLIISTHNEYIYKNVDNDVMHKWFLELTNKLYGAFYDHKH
jgi:hypothetical protein